MNLLAGVLALGMAIMFIKWIDIDLSLSFHRTNKLNQMIMSKEASIIISASLGMWGGGGGWNGFLWKYQTVKLLKKNCI